MRTGTLYCEKSKSGKYNHFYPSKAQLRLCGAKEDDVVSVILTEDQMGTHWGWWDNKTNDFSMVYPQRFLVTICSPDAFKAATERGDGEILAIRVSEDK
jgi:hypothetical protein